MLDGGREGGGPGFESEVVFIFLSFFFASLVFNFLTSFTMGYVTRLAAPE